jgi:hypothetical protein
MANKIVGFLTNLGAAKKGKAGGDFQQVLSQLPMDASDGLKHVFDNVTDYLKVAEQEKTNRAKIEANKTLALTAIQNQRAMIEKLIDRTFDERGLVLAKQFEALDHALAAGNLEIVQASLSGMVAVIQTSPFKSVQEMQQALGAKDFVVRLE